MPDDSSATASSPDSDAQPPERLKLAEQVGFYIDIWKKSVDVQQHFNDIQWRIRGLALTVATFTLGAAGIAAKDSTRIGIISLGALIGAVGLLLWYAFYFVDRYWYHVFLKSSVSQGLELEHAIADFLPKAQLTEKSSPTAAAFTQGPSLIAHFVSGCS
ncbi:hypothetical protein [Nocardia africana]|uniref:hypothetical protein n=1 Tax=Nocardia africana TaxID=134964 RepID=UPI000FE18857|nr:hypothetical protein [Nocardia africana]